MEVRKIRLIRMKYHISLRSLAKESGISAQRINEIELCCGGFEQETLRKLKKGMSEIMFRRNEECTELFETLKKHSDTLLDVVEETTYEL